MAFRPTQHLVADEAGIASAARILRAGGLVAFPTETVYGLGSHALDAEAVRGIFEAKSRPANDPLIVHLASASDVDSVAEPTRDSERLAECFWPWPLTLQLPKRADVPLEVTAGLNTVGVRVPSHTIARQLLAQANLPVP